MAKPCPKPQGENVVPTKATLEKYGLTEADFLARLDEQGGVCAICGKVPTPSKKDGKVRFVVDHEHVRGYKKMKPEERKKYVRGLVCWYDNRYFLSKGITVEKSKAVTLYLENYEKRKSL